MQAREPSLFVRVHPVRRQYSPAPDSHEVKGAAFFVLISMVFAQHINLFFGKVQAAIANNAGWFYVLTMNIILFAAIMIAFSRFGDIRLGGPDAEPEFTTFGWFAMLFSAGMGIGLLFYGVAEPLFHYVSSPLDAPGSLDAARDTFGLTFLHWGLHPWGVYSLVGLALAFSSFNHGKRLTIRNAFYPLFGDRVNGWPGHVIDIAATVATMFGVATSLGLGVKQVNAFVQNVGHYLQNFFSYSTWNETYAATDWQNAWTVFYWGWWIAWSPFVGMFIARVSRGRTVREFVLGVLFAPTLVTFMWITVFGDSALYVEMFGSGGLAKAVQENIPVSLFLLLEKYPLSQLSCGLGIICVISFFVTSSDSGSMVIDIITARESDDPPIPQRLFWAITEGVVAAALLVGGGLVGLQTAAITTGLPFAVILLIMIYSLYKGMDRYLEVGHQAYTTFGKREKHEGGEGQ